MGLGRDWAKSGYRKNEVIRLGPNPVRLVSLHEEVGTQTCTGEGPREDAKKTASVRREKLQRNQPC